MTGNSCYRGGKRLTPRHQGPWVESCLRPMLMLTYSMIYQWKISYWYHWANQTVIDFSTKLQSTVETATFGSNMLLPGPPLNRSLISGAPSDTSGTCCPLYCYVFGDNESVVNTASMPFSKLNKRHNASITRQGHVCCKHSTVYSYSWNLQPS
jgi:hypothetical protein